MIEYKITFKNHIKHLIPLLTYVAVIISIMLSKIVDPISDIWIMRILYFLLIVICGINLYLHLEYYFTNKGVSLYYNEKNHMIKYIKGGKEKVITRDIIDKIEHYKSHYSERTYASDNFSYFFYKIILKENNCFNFFK